jgi:elongation factor G
MTGNVSTDPRNIRNVVLTGAGGSGKTTITERLLFLNGTTKRLGTVEEGNTVSDYSEEEKHHKHSLQPSFVHFSYEGHDVHLIDTPGLGDFLGHAISCFPAVETVVVVIDALKGIQSVTRRLMQVAAERKIPRMVVINKIDESQADIPALVAQVREAFGAICLPINLPTAGGAKVINVFEHDGNDAAGDQTDFSSVHEAHRQIVEQVIEVDEDLTMQYLEKGEGFDPEKLHAAFEKALESAHLVPICFCSAKTGAGCDDLLHLLREPVPEPGGGEPAGVSEARGGMARTRNGTPSRRRRRRSSLTFSRSRPTRSWASWASSACIRARSSTRARCCSTTRRSRCGSTTCTSCRARTTSRSIRLGRARSARSRRSTRCGSTA